MSEPVITINGITLTEAQAMTVRVSVTNFRSRMDSRGALGKDETGEAIRQGYLARSTEIVSLMLTPSPSTHMLALMESGQAFANQVRAVTHKLHGQAYSSTVSALNQFDADLRRARALATAEGAE